MHACLYVDEIIRLIACELVGSRANATTVALACCRKNFEDPALDSLWETQEELLPLFKSLPGDVWNDDRCTVSVSTKRVFSSLNCLVWKSFRRLPTPAEWARFKKYARNIRHLGEWVDLDDLPSRMSSILQFRSANNDGEPLLPNLKTLMLGPATPELIPFIPSLLSPRITGIDVMFETSDLPKAMLISMISTFSTLRPNLEFISLDPLPRDPAITAAVSRMFLASNRDTLRRFHVDSPLTEEAREVIYKLPDLSELSMVVERDNFLSPVVLPGLTKLHITLNHSSDWLQEFRGAAFGKLEAVSFHCRSEQIGDILEAFERVALAASVQNTLSEFNLRSSFSWHPNYYSLLPFTHLTVLTVGFSCDDGCSSTVDDDIITNIARSMPRLVMLRLGEPPCQTPTGVTAKGLTLLAHHCPDLQFLCIHFQVASLGAPPAVTEVASDVDPTALRRNYTLTVLEVGEIPVSVKSVPMTAMTLSHIFPCLAYVDENADENWGLVMNVIRIFR